MEKKRYHKINKANIYQLLTGVMLPLAESLRDDAVGVGVGVLLLFAFACSTSLTYIA